MKRMVLAIALLSLAFDAGAAIQVRVAVRQSGGQDLILIGRSDEALRLQLPGQGGSIITAPLKDIRYVRFEFPDHMRRGLSAYEHGKYDAAAKLLRPLIEPYFRYLDAPQNNALPIAMMLADSLLKSEDFPGALKVYDDIQEVARPPANREARLWMTYCLIEMGQTEAAAKLLKGIEITDHHNELYPLYHLVHARSLYAANEFGKAVDSIAQALAASRLESKLYAECLFVAARCYEAYGKEYMDTLDMENREEASYRDDSILPLDLEDLPEVADSMYRQIIDIFPHSPWSENAKAYVTLEEEDKQVIPNEDIMDGGLEDETEE